MTFSVSAATVTRDPSGRVLLVQRRDTGEWQIPGGVVEIGEDPVDAAKRETLEEAGVEVEVCGLSGVYTNIKKGIVAFVFEATATGGEPCATEESVATEWVDFTLAVNRVSDIFKDRIRDIEDDRVVFATHDGHNFISRR